LSCPHAQAIFAVIVPHPTAEQVDDIILGSDIFEIVNCYVQPNLVVLGAGNDIARAQQGAGKMTIGVNFLKYSQKHAHFGKATAPQSGFSPKSKLTNSVRHTTDRHVMARNAFDKAHKYGLSKTQRWYRETLKALNKKP
jgi:hypothetical protein